MNPANGNELRKRYSDADLAEFKELIERKLEVSRQEMVYLQEQLLEINEEADAIKAGNFDEGSQNYEREHLAKMIGRTQDFIRNLEFALIRIQNKTYGICSITGELIEKKRLLLVPHTTKSIEGKSIESKTAQQPKPEQNRLRLSTDSNGKPKVITKAVVGKKSAGGAKNEEWEEDDLNEFDMDMGLDDIDITPEIPDTDE